MNQKNFMNRKKYLLDKFKVSNMLTHSSIAFQVSEILKLINSDSSILEIGPSDGSLGYLLKWTNYKYTSVDINELYEPDILGDFLKSDLLINKKSDLVCAFQVMEHTPLNLLDLWIKRFSKCTKNYLIISLPDSRPRLSFDIDLAILGKRKNFKLDIGPFDFKGREPKNIRKTFGGVDNYAPHYWELGKGIKAETIVEEFQKYNFKILWNKANPHFRYHSFFCFKKIQ